MDHFIDRFKLWFFLIRQNKIGGISIYSRCGFLSRKEIHNRWSVGKFEAIIQRIGTWFISWRISLATNFLRRMLHRLFFLADFLIAKIAREREREGGNKIARKFSPRTMAIYGSYTKERNILGRRRKRERELALNRKIKIVRILDSLLTIFQQKQ